MQKRATTERGTATESDTAFPFLKGIPYAKAAQKTTRQKGGQKVSQAAREKGCPKGKGFPFERYRQRDLRGRPFKNIQIGEHKRMKKDCKNCLYSSYNEEELDIWCNYYDCRCNEVAREKENPSCWEDMPPDYYDAHTCDYQNGCCTICGKVEYKSMLYCELYGCDP